MSQVEEESDCSYDFVEVYDGTSDSARRFGRFCGQHVSYAHRHSSYAFRCNLTVYSLPSSRTYAQAGKNLVCD